MPPPTSTPHPRAFLSPPASGETFSAVGDVYVIRARGQDTGGTLALAETRVPPGGGPPPHVHSLEDESFYVLEGEISFFTAEGRTVGGPGTFVHLPRGVPHTFKNESNREARMLVWCSPAGFDRMVEAMGVRLAGPSSPPAPVTPEHIQHVAEVASRFGISFVERLDGAGPSS